MQTFLDTKQTYDSQSKSFNVLKFSKLWVLYTYRRAGSAEVIFILFFNLKRWPIIGLCYTMYLSLDANVTLSSKAASRHRKRGVSQTMWYTQLSDSLKGSNFFLQNELRCHALRHANNNNNNTVYITARVSASNLKSVVACKLKKS